MARKYVPDSKKDAAYYKKRSNNAASVKLFREKKRKAEEEHNRKITNLKKMVDELVTAIQLLTRDFQFAANNLSYHYVSNLNNVYNSCNREILRQMELLKNIAYDIPEIKTRNYGLKKIRNDNNCGGCVQNDNSVNLTYNCTVHKCDTKYLEVNMNQISLKN